MDLILKLFLDNNAEQVAIKMASQPGFAEIQEYHKKVLDRYGIVITTKRDVRRNDIANHIKVRRNNAFIIEVQDGRDVMVHTMTFMAA